MHSKVKIIVAGIVTIIASLVMILQLCGWLDPVHPREVTDAVQVARFRLGRWPRNWSEIASAAPEFGSVGDYYSSITIYIVNESMCLVVQKGRSLIGVPFEYQRKVCYDSRTEEDIKRLYGKNRQKSTE